MNFFIAAVSVFTANFIVMSNGDFTAVRAFAVAGLIFLAGLSLFSGKKKS